jgi:hypothetical protein
MARFIAFVAMVVLLAGCAQQPTTRFARYTEVTYPPTAEVQVHRTKPSDRAYVELGEVRLRLNKGNEDDAILFLNNKAREVGANAIVILGEESRGAALVPIDNMAMAVPIRDIVAVAIRYK